MRLLDFSAGVAVAAIALIAAEGTVRLTGWPPPQESNDSGGSLRPVLAGSAELGWTVRAGSSGAFDFKDASRSYDAEGYNTLDSAQVHDKTRPKILFIGGSDAFGYGVPPERTFVEVADRLLPDFDAINLGVPGYSSAQGVLVARKYIPALKPRIAVFSFGFNDRRDAQDRLPDGPEQFLAVYRTSGEYAANRVRSSLARSRLIEALEEFARRQSAPPPPAADQWLFHLSKARPRVDESHYAGNLSDMADICASQGVTPIFLLLGDNPGLVARLDEAVILVETGRAEVALPILRSLLGEDADSTVVNLARLTMAAAYRSLGRPADAAAAIQEPIRFPFPPFDGMDPVRPDIVYHRVMRRVAAFKKVELVDGAAILRDRSDGFLDVAHLSEAGHHLVGEAVARRISALFGADGRSAGSRGGTGNAGPSRN